MGSGQEQWRTLRKLPTWWPTGSTVIGLKVWERVRLAKKSRGRDFPGSPGTKTLHPQCTGLGSAPALPWDWGSQTDKEINSFLSIKSPDAEISELKTAEGGSSLHLTAKSPLLNGALKRLKFIYSRRSPLTFVSTFAMAHNSRVGQHNLLPLT